MNKELTADTITDEQIRDLECSTSDVETRVLTKRALAEVYGTDEVSRLLYRLHSSGLVDQARARCAEIINARQKGGLT